MPRHRLLLPAAALLAIMSLAGASAVNTSAAPTPAAAPVTHGADAPPAGVDVTEPVTVAELLADANLPAAPQALAATAPAGTPPTVLLSRHVPRACYGTGTDGNRVQVFYAREADQPNRYAQVLPVLQHEVANVDDTFALSARKTGGGKRVRWVTDANCNPVITPIVLPDGALGSDFGKTVAAMSAAGYTSKDRKYLLFSDGTALCGIAQMFDDSRKVGNLNDGRAALIQRVDQGCWTRGEHSTAAHELMHSIGGVTSTAPHTSGNLHCNDDYDVMCYPDGGTHSNIKVVCPGAEHDYLFDCNNDDYFHTQPAEGTYLAINWNTADSSFLMDATPLSSPVKVAITSSVPAFTPGRAFTLTATTAGQSYAWTGPHLTTARTGRSVTVNVPAGVFSATYSVKVGAPDGVASLGARTLSSTVPPASTSLSIAQSAGYPTKLTSTLTKTGTTTRLGNAPLVVQTRAYGATAWTTAARVTTNPSGHATYSVYPKRLHDYRFVFAGGGKYKPATSAAARVKVPTTTAISARTGRPNTISGTIKARATAAPATGVAVVLQARRSGSATWANVATVKTTTGAFSYRVQPKRGTYYRWVLPSTGTYLWSASAQRYVAY